MAPTVAQKIRLIATDSAFFLQ